MKPSIVVGVLVLAVGGIAGASWVASANSEAELRERLAQAEASLEAQTRKLSALQAELDDLRNPGSSYEAPASFSTASPAAVSGGSEMSSLTISSAAPAHGARTPAVDPVNGAPTPTPQFQEWVRKVIADQKAEEEAKLKAAEEQRRVERVNRRVDRAVETLALTGLQKEQFRSALLAEETGRAQIFEKFRNSGELFGFGDPGEGQGMGDAMRENRRVRDEALKSILTPEQYEKWNAQDRRGSFFGGPGGPGGGGNSFNRGAGSPSKSGGQ